MPVEEIRTLTEGLMADVTEDLAALVRIPSRGFPGFPAEPMAEMAAAVVERGGTASAAWRRRGDASRMGHLASEERLLTRPLYSE